MAGRAVVACALSILGSIGTAGAQAQFSYEALAGGWTGDGAAATAASLHGVEDVAYDSAGNLYVSQMWANRIRKITPGGTISTVVGGNVGFTGDGGAAAQARIHHPSGLVVDTAGNLYFSDRENNRVRRIAANGTITTFAGNGTAASSGDGGQATSAAINEPAGLALDTAGNLFIAERMGNRVRKVTPAGVISTVAGTSTYGYAGDGGAATAAQLALPEDVDVDASGKLYIADTDNGVVRLVTGGTISTYQGGLLFPLSVKADKSGGVWMSSTDCTLTYRTATTQVLYGEPGVCGQSPDGTATSAAMMGVVIGITLDAAGNIVFADSDNSRVAKITKSNMQLATLAGTKPVVANGTAGASARLSVLNALSVDDAGAIALSDYLYAYRIRKLAGGKVSTVAGNGSSANTCSGTCTGALDYGFGRVSGIASAPNGTIYFADRIWNKVFRVFPNGAFAVFAGGGTGTGENVAATSLAIRARGIAADAAGNVYLADTAAHRVRKVTPQGIVNTIAGNGTSGSTGDGGLATAALVQSPTQIAVDAAGNVYFNQTDGELRRIGTNGIIQHIAGAPTPPPALAYSGEGGSALAANLGSITSIAAHWSGVFFVSEGKVRRITPDGRVETTKGFDHHAYGLAIKRNVLYVSTEGGRVLRTPLPRRIHSDFDGDKKSDIVWRDITTGANTIWKAANNTTQQSVQTAPIAMKLAAHGDFDGDGKADLVWRNTNTGANTIWRTANANTAMVLTTSAPAWAIAGAGDFNADGKSDLLWRHATTGQNVVWPSGQSTGAWSLSTMADLQWTVAGIGDFDADGRSDVVWRHGTTGADQLWLSGNSATRKTITNVTNTAWKIVGVGDFDGDGYADLLWRNAASGANTIWRLAVSTTPITVAAVAAGPAWTVAGTGDYDNDGKADLLWRNTTTGANQLWKSANGATRVVLPAVGTVWQPLP